MTLPSNEAGHSNYRLLQIFELSLMLRATVSYSWIYDLEYSGIFYLLENLETN